MVSVHGNMPDAYNRPAVTLRTLTLGTCFAPRLSATRRSRQPRQLTGSRPFPTPLPHGARGPSLPNKNPLETGPLAILRTGPAPNQEGQTRRRNLCCLLCGVTVERSGADSGGGRPSRLRGGPALGMRVAPNRSGGAGYLPPGNRSSSQFVTTQSPSESGSDWKPQTPQPLPCNPQ